MADTALLVCDVQNDPIDPKGNAGAPGLARIGADRNLLANLKKAEFSIIQMLPVFGRAVASGAIN
jgi:nicotinamidase-related amidase